MCDPVTWHCSSLVLCMEVLDMISLWYEQLYSDSLIPPSFVCFRCIHLAASSDHKSDISASRMLPCLSWMHLLQVKCKCRSCWNLWRWLAYVMPATATFQPVAAAIPAAAAEINFNTIPSIDCSCPIENCVMVKNCPWSYAHTTLFVDPVMRYSL